MVNWVCCDNPCFSQESHKHCQGNSALVVIVRWASSLFFELLIRKYIKQGLGKEFENNLFPHLFFFSVFKNSWFSSILFSELWRRCFFSCIQHVLVCSSHFIRCRWGLVTRLMKVCFPGTSCEAKALHSHGLPRRSSSRFVFCIATWMFLLPLFFFLF